MGLRPDGDEPDSEEPNIDLSSLDKGTSASALTRNYTFKETLASKVFWILIMSFFLAGMSHPIMIVHSVAAITDEIQSILGIPVSTFMPYEIDPIDMKPLFFSWSIDGA